jgi:agmatine deiminase
VTAKRRAPSLRLPAEWESHAATWISWPRNASDWPGKFAAIPWAFAEIARLIAPGEILRIIVASAAHETRARRALTRAGVAPDRVRFHRIASDRGWTRDTGPITVRRGARGVPAVVRFRFTAWARYADWRRDDAVAPRAARALGLPLVAATHAGRQVVLEGGAVVVNGRGTLITTEECLLDPVVQVRNPGFGRRDYEEIFERWLGARNVIWLGRGIAGDDTHGHVDDLCRFVGPRTVVVCEERNVRDANHAALAENRERLAGARLEDGSKLEVVGLPLPAPLFFDGRRLPASYANFYVANAAVLVPTFNDPQDRVALGILGELFRDRPVIGVHAVDLVWGLGTLHCLTQQQPAPGRR